MKAIADDYLAELARVGGPARARTVVLLPDARLLALAAARWAQAGVEGFAPRFETTQSWANSLRLFEPSGDDLRFDLAMDLLIARRLLSRTLPGHHLAQASAWACMLVQAAYTLAPLAAACPVAERGAWGARLSTALRSSFSGDTEAVESLLSQLALAWVSTSAYASDVLFEPLAQSHTDTVLALQGAQPDPVLQALQDHWGDRCRVRPLMPDEPGQMTAALEFHACLHAQDEAQVAAACVLRHLAQDCASVALVAQDRALTRRIRALLAGAGVAVRDDTGWKLSTSHLGAQLMQALRACRARASADEVLAWLKQSPGWDAAMVQRLEDHLRVLGQNRWDALTLAQLDDEGLPRLWATIQERRRAWLAPRPLADWLLLLREGLVQDGLWQSWQEDAAGMALTHALRLDAPARLQEMVSLRPWRAAEFLDWVDEVLEGVSFRPVASEAAAVVILPLAQMLGRSFDAVVIAGCDEVRLPSSPEPEGWWTPVQRTVLGLPTRQELSHTLLRIWQAALSSPAVDLLWRRHDDAGETLLASPLVRLLQLQLQRHDLAADPRARREVMPQPVLRPSPCASVLPPDRLSASAYQDLRQCPYRFFALRQLGLRQAEELESVVSKRDFGLWLHSVLQQFHARLAAQATTGRPERLRLLEASAEQARQMHQLAADEFLPFLAAWPAVRDSYLDWLDRHEASGARFEQGEAWHEQRLGDVRLVGQIDRIDRLNGPGPRQEWLLIDYKTESIETTRKRLSEPMEDTQLAFYAALLPYDTVQAAYLHLGERGEVKLLDQPHVNEVRDALVAGVVDELQRIAADASLPALGEGAVCDQCAARGLCRKDFWGTAP